MDQDAMDQDAMDQDAVVPVRGRKDGWTVARQRAFLLNLAETGCVSEACAEVGITPRSAYRLRAREDARAFRTAWHHAEGLATQRLRAIAFERAVHGTVEKIYRGGELVEERHRPNDRLLMWLLTHHDPAGYGALSRPQPNPHSSDFLVQCARREIDAQLTTLTEIDPATCPADPLGPDDLDLDDAPARA